jgi:glycosyltransferase involved in cell wall biosynthesis
VRIAYLHFLTEGDTGRHHVRQFVAGARALGHQVDVHAMNLAPAGDGSLPAGGLLRGSARRIARRLLARYLHEPKELIWNVRYISRGTRLLRSQAPDVLLVRDPLLNVSCVPIARQLGLPLALEVNAPAAERDLYFSEHLHLPFVARWTEAYKLRHADAVTVVSTSLKDHLVVEYGIPGEKITIAPNGADLELFHPAVQPANDVAPRGSGPVVGFVGSFRKWHGTDLLAGMIREVGAARPHVRFLLVGDGPEADALRAATDGLRERVVFTGRVPHERVPALVAALDIGVMPHSNFYGSPLKVIEWMAAGRAIVAPDLPPLRDVIVNGTEGLLFPPRDGVALTRSVLRLVDDPPLRSRLGAAAANRARSSLSWQHNARLILSACEDARRRRDPEGRARGARGVV